MRVPDPKIIEAGQLDEAISALPNSDAVFLVRTGERSAYLAKTSMLRRRLLRILRAAREGASRSLNLREVATRVEYWLTGSRFESMLVHYALAREHFPDDYGRLVKLRMPAYIKLVLSNEFPRTQVTTRLSPGNALYYGPFRTRAGAELFDNHFLDFFQIRRCQETLQPSPQHPGCIYGEMNMCMRPCQAVVGREEYLAETGRVREFLTGNGAALLNVTSAARDRLSEELDFEAAAREHKRLERIQEVLALRDDLVTDLDHLYGVAVAPAADPGSILLWFVCEGAWQAPRVLALDSHESLDARLREVVQSLQPEQPPLPEKQEHVALLARWHYSTWSDGEWIGFRGLEEVPYRKLVRAIGRVRRKDEAQVVAEPSGTG